MASFSFLVYLSIDYSIWLSANDEKRVYPAMEQTPLVDEPAVVFLFIYDLYLHAFRHVYQVF